MVITNKQKAIITAVTCIITAVAVWFWVVEGIGPQTDRKPPRPAGVEQPGVDHLQEIIAGALGQPVHQATLMHDAHGVIGHDPATMFYGFQPGSGCTFKNYYLVVYIACAILVQPGTARQWDIKLERAIGSIAATVAALMTAACVALGFGIFTPACIIIAGYYLNEIKTALDAARNNHQCLRIRFDYVPAGNPVPMNFRFDNYGQWEQWRGTPPFLKGVYPTSCRMPTANPCRIVNNCL